MNRPTAIKRIIFLGIFLVLGFFLCFAQFEIPFTHYTYNGFANSIKLGLDLKGGVLAVYEASPIDGDSTDFDSKLNATRQRITDLITASYTEAVISIQQGNRLRVEVPDVADPEEVFNLIGTPAILEFKKEKSADAEAVLTGQNIVSCSASQQQASGSGYLEWGVSITFDAEGAQKFYELTSELVGSKIYIYSNGECISEPTVNSAIAGGKTFISGSMDEQGAKDFALQILSGTFSVKLSLLENTVVSATLGDKALLYGLIAGGIALLIIFAFMIWRYKMLGVISSVALSFYVILMLFFLQAIPLVQLTLAGIAGIILSIGMAIDGNIVIFERIKEEYASGKKILPSIDSGFKKAFWAIFDSNITTIMVAIVLALLGTGSIQGFAITLLIGVVLSMFTSLVVTRQFLKLYYPLNSTNAKQYGLKRGEGVDELA